MRTPAKVDRSKDPRFRLLFEDNPQPMWVFDSRTLELLDVNRSAVERYGYSRPELLQKSLADIHPPEEIPRLRLSLDSARDGVVQVWHHKLKGGKVIDVEMPVHRIDYQGRQAALAVLLDVSQRRVLEEQLRQAQKMEAVGMLAGGIAHDFNNLLTIITGYSQLILNSFSQEDVNRSSIEQILKAAERAAALTRQLLAFSRRQVLQPKVIDVNQLVTSLGVMLRRLIGEDVDLRLVMSPDSGRINVDPGQLEQVIMNLAVNARDAMPRGGVLTIETRNVELDEHYAETHLSVRPGRYVLIGVSDNGVGMDAETRAHLFEPFFTTKGHGKGTGLGLSIVFGIIKQSGGNIEVYSEKGHGTSVKIFMPRADQATVTEVESAGTRAAGGSETILLVEDEEMVRRLVRETLERAGYKLLDAGSPAEALRICRDYDRPIHLMITDVVMPELNGRELAEQAAARRPEMKVLYMSGYTDNAVVGLMGGDMPFLEKPFTPTTLARKVRQVLEQNGKSRHA